MDGREDRLMVIVVVKEKKARVREWEWKRGGNVWI